MSKDKVEKLNNDISDYIKKQAEEAGLEIVNFDLAMLISQGGGAYFTTSIKGKTIGDFITENISAENFAMYDIINTIHSGYKVMALRLVTAIIAYKKKIFSEEEMDTLVSVLKTIKDSIDGGKENEFSEIFDSSSIENGSDKEIKSMVLKFVEALKR